MAKMTQRQESNRLIIENELAELDAVLDDLGLVALRLEQAMRRSRLSELLGPALTMLTKVIQRVRHTQRVMRSVAALWEERNWW